MNSKISKEFTFNPTQPHTAVQYNYTPHQFAPEIEHQLKQLSQNVDNYHCFMEIATDILIIFACIWISYIYFADSMLVYLLSIIVIACRHRALADILHQSAHRCLAGNETLNYCLGLLVGWPIFQSWSGYVVSHVRDHHHQLGHSIYDPDVVAIIKKGLYPKNRNMRKRKILLYFLRLLSQVGWFEYLSQDLIPNRILQKDENLIEKQCRIMLYLIVSLLVEGTQYAQILLWYWIVPMLTTTNIIGAFIELVEHYPFLDPATIAVDIKDRNDVFMSRNRMLGPIWNWFLGTHDEHFQLLHHLKDRIPNWRYREAHALMMQDPYYGKLTCHTRPGMRECIKSLFEPQYPVIESDPKD